MTVLTNTVTLAAGTAIIWNNHRGRNYAANHLDTKFDNVQADISCLEKKVEADISGVKADISRLGKKVEADISGVKADISGVKADISRVEKKLED
ncbi:hypothetical protein L873DRAFT_1803543, partial [Choiromyces venosus 120613-1]